MFSFHLDQSTTPNGQRGKDSAKEPASNGNVVPLFDGGTDNLEPDCSPLHPE
jgi:hypothetical protein